MTSLARGATVPLSSPVLELAVTGAVTGSVDLLVFQVAGNGKVRSDADMVFFKQPESPEGAVRLTGPGSVQLTLAAIPAEVVTLVVSVALDDSVTDSLATIAGLAVAIRGDVDTQDAPADGLTSERAAILVEIYRRGDGWKVRNVSAGWDAGLAALAREYGVAVDEPGSAVPQQVPGPPASSTTWPAPAQPTPATSYPLAADPPTAAPPAAAPPAAAPPAATPASRHRRPARAPSPARLGCRNSSERSWIFASNRCMQCCSPRMPPRSGPE